MADTPTASAANQKLSEADSIAVDQASALGATVFRFGHAVLLLCTTLALAYLAFGHQTSPPAPADWQRFALPGYELASKGHDKADVARDLSHSGVARFDAAPCGAAKNPFSISLVAARTRKNADLNLIYLTEHFAALALEGGGKERPGGNDVKTTKVAMGNLSEKRALQTCITPAGVAATTAGDLNADIGAAREQGFRARWLQLIGQQPPARWECALVTIEVAASATADQDVLAIWADVYAAWRANPPWPVEKGLKD